MESSPQAQSRKIFPKQTGGSAKDDVISPLKTPSASKASLQRRNSNMRGSVSGSTQYTVALAEVKSDGDEADLSYYEKFIVFLKNLLRNSWFGKIYEWFIIVASVASAIEYIYQTYKYSNPDNTDDKEIYYGDQVELAFTALFGMDWIMNFLIADHFTSYFFSFSSFVDILVIISVITTYQVDPMPYSQLLYAKDIVYYVLFGLKTVRILRAVWASKVLMLIEDVVERFIADMSLTISVMILFFSAIVQYLEWEEQLLPFHTWMYYIWVTIATVGYGDITPRSILGRIAAMGFIAYSIISIPQMTNELFEKMSLQSIYMRAVYNPKRKNTKHILLIGDLTSTALLAFFEELYHEDHENIDLHTVILLPVPPSVELLFLFRNPAYKDSLTYLEGSALIETDLKRAKAENAVAIFIMTNKFHTNPDEEDAKSILLNFSIKHYLSRFVAPNILFCMQLIRPQNKRHLQSNSLSIMNGNMQGNSSESEGMENDLIVCLNEIKLGVMAKSAMYPGSSAFFMNLITSFSDEDLSLDGDSSDTSQLSILARVKAQCYGQPEALITDNLTNSPAWLSEYLEGCGWEIYTTTLSNIFVGAKFSELSYSLYDKLGVVLFALQVTDHQNGGYSKVLLNPASYIIPNQENYGIEAFVLAKNKSSSDLSFNKSTPLQGIQGLAGIIRADANRPLAARESFMDRKRKTTVMPRRMAAEKDVFGRDTDNTPSGPAVGSGKSKWGLLKKSSLANRKIETSNYEELLHKLDHAHFQQSYYLHPTGPIDIAEVTVQTGVMEEYPNINNHLIIIGKGVRNLYDLIRPLRAKYLGPLRYIVILYPHDIPTDVWQRINVFDSVLVVRGSPLEEVNLRRAGIFRAAQVIVLAEGSSGKDVNKMDALVDSDAIFAYQHIKRMNPTTQVIIEIVNQSSISYLQRDLKGPSSSNPTNNDSKTDNFKFTPLFASGTVFTTALLDSIICQTFYNPQILTVVNQLLSGIDQLEALDLPYEAARQFFAKSDALQEDQSDDDSAHAHSPTNEGNGDAQKLMSKLLKVPGSCLYQITVPDEMAKKTYGELYQHLSIQGIIPLGLLRGTFTNMRIGPKDNKQPYVYTNPKKETELFSCDRVFVLSIKPLQVNRTDIKDWLFDIKAQRDRANSSNSARTRPPSAVVIDSVEKTQKKLDEKVHKLSVDVNKKLSTIMTMIEGMKDQNQSQNETQNTLRLSMSSARSTTLSLSADELGEEDRGLVLNQRTLSQRNQDFLRKRVDSEMSEHNIYGDNDSTKDSTDGYRTNNTNTPEVLLTGGGGGHPNEQKEIEDIRQEMENYRFAAVSPLTAIRKVSFSNTNNPATMTSSSVKKNSVKDTQPLPPVTDSPTGCNSSPRSILKKSTMTHSHNNNCIVEEKEAPAPVVFFNSSPPMTSVQEHVQSDSEGSSVAEHRHLAESSSGKIAPLDVVISQKSEWDDQLSHTPSGDNNGYEGESETGSSSLKIPIKMKPVSNPNSSPRIIPGPKLTDVTSPLSDERIAKLRQIRQARNKSESHMTAQPEEGNKGTFNLPHFNSNASLSQHGRNSAKRLSNWF